MHKRIVLFLLGSSCAAMVGGAVICSYWETDSASVSAPTPVIDDRPIADAGLILASKYEGEIGDPQSLADLQAAIRQRGSGALAALQAELAEMQRVPTPDLRLAARLHYEIGTIMAYEGRFDDAINSLEESLAINEQAKEPLEVRARLTAILGVFSLRLGEVDNCINCVGPSSCILPIAPDAVHTRTAGSRQAIEWFEKYLEMQPGDLRVRWLLNLAFMTLGEYPEKVPQQYLIPLDHSGSTADVGRFLNVAPLVGLTSRGPSQAGGSIFDDFTGDGLPDLFITSLDADRGASLYVNRGDGRFEDTSDVAGLADQIYALNLAHADFDNDGYLDVVLLRGGWEMPMRMSLLRNTGNSSFEDVTIASGLDEPIATESAAWGDYDNDGLVDLFVCGEYTRTAPDGSMKVADPRNRCRLYHNEGNGKFIDVAPLAGVVNERRAKGSAWGDYDGDGRIDLFVSNMNSPGRLYHNDGNGTFHDVAPAMEVEGPANAFACWFWDYDNDGRLDLYVNDYTSSLAEHVAISLGLPVSRSSRPCLYRNVGPSGFRDLAGDAGLSHGMMPMGCNFADVDNDGFLDIYLGTGRMSLDALTPNEMFKNDKGRSFTNVTFPSGTGHLQKGHGVSFADWDCDGDLDLFVVAGGAVPGDRSYNVLFQNPGHGRHWLKVKLDGTRTNRAALGARIKATIKSPDGNTRTIFRTIGNNGSFGGNSLVELIGLADATSVTELVVSWPTSRTVQTFRDVPADQTIEITEEVDAVKQIHLPPLPVSWQAD